MFLTLSLQLVLLGSTQAARSLLQVAPCGEFIPNVDIPGANLPGSGTVVADPQACVDLCVDTDTCNAAILVPGGLCFLKNVDVDTVQPVASAGLTSYLVCDDIVDPPIPGPGPDPEPCGEFIADVDIPGANLPGSGAVVADPEACRDLCFGTDTCNAAIFVPSGACFLKSVDVANVVPSPWPGLTSFLGCDSEGPVDPPAPEPVEPPAPMIGGAECGEFLPDADIPGANLPGSGTFTADAQACVDLCTNTDTCNAAIRVPGGPCFLKSVDLETVQPVSSPGLTSFLLCPMMPNPDCDTFIANVDVPGANLPGTASTSSNEECLSVCRANPPCNSFARVAGGGCFLKEVDFATVELPPAAGVTGYLDCNPPVVEESAWRELKSIPASIGEVSSGVLTAADGKDYLITVGEHGNGDPKNGLTFIYDIAQDTWFEGGARPLIGNHHNAEVIDNKLYLIGGLGGGSAGEIQIGSLTGGTPGNPLTMTWTQGADAPLNTGSANSAFIGGLVYLCGGIVPGSGTIPDCNVYDPSTDTWLDPSQAPPDMPAGRNHAAACTDGSKMYAFGGRIGGNAPGQGFDDTQIFTPGSGWTTGAPLPFGRGGMGRCVCTGGKCYVFGGEVPGSTAPSLANKINNRRTLFSTDIYDIATDSWSFGPDMPEGLHGIFPVLYNGKVYIAGGGTVWANSQSSLVYEFTP